MKMLVMNVFDSGTISMVPMDQTVNSMLQNKIKVHQVKQISGQRISTITHGVTNKLQLQMLQIHLRLYSKQQNHLKILSSVSMILF